MRRATETRGQIRTKIVLLLFLSPQFAAGQVKPDTVCWSPNRVGTYIKNTGWFNMWDVERGYGLRWPAGDSDPLVTASSRFLFAGKKRGGIVTATADFHENYEADCYNCEFSPGRVFRRLPGMPGQPAEGTHSSGKIYAIQSGDEHDPSENPDYLNWPIEDGAPGNADGRPLVAGSSTVWCVFNDFARDTSVLESPAAGIVVQMTAWAMTAPTGLATFCFPVQNDQ